jgi:LuxR family maltose regulon positive regulatory protein
MMELLSTKVSVPRSRTNAIPRRKLHGRLDAGQSRKLTLVVGPPGFGKTTLVSEWIHECPHAFAWLSLDDSDDLPAQFWAYFIRSLQQLHPHLGERALALLQSPQPPAIHAMLTALINEASELPEELSIVLDDYHAIHAPSIHEALGFLIDHLPANMHLIITARADPPLALARLRAHDQLTELREADLRFDSDDAASFLAQTMGLTLSEDEIAALEARTEGWIAGLQIAALSLQGRDDISGFIRTFSGSHRHVLGYLADEVLNSQSEERVAFLLRTSILSRLSGPLCDAVTGNSGSQATLKELELASLFITRQDDEGVWYRYHPLFAEVLGALLQQTQAEEVPELHRRAGRWHASHGMTDEAVLHLLAGGDFEEAARLIESQASDMLRQGCGAMLMRWLEAMPEEIIHSRPLLCLARGWTFLWGPEPHVNRVDEWVDRALRAALADPASDPEIAGQAAVLRATSAAIRWDPARSRAFSRQALDLLPVESPWRSVMLLCLGTAYFYGGDLAPATDALSEARAFGLADGAPYVHLMAASFLADVQVIRGHLSSAVEMYHQVLTDNDSGLPLRGTVMAHGGLAGIFCERNQLDDAAAHLQTGNEQLGEVGGAWTALALYRAAARLHAAKGNWGEALDVLDRACQSGEGAEVDLVVAQSGALRARMQLALGNVEAATAWAAESGLNQDDPGVTHPGLRETEYLTLARVLCARGSYEESLALLDRLMQSADTEQRTGSAIAILTQQSLALRARGNPDPAFRCLDRALSLAESEGFVRTFVDEGAPLQSLLQDYRRLTQQRLGHDANRPLLRRLALMDKLLAAFSQPASNGRTEREASFGTLSERELDVMRLIAEGRSNQEIAALLVIALSTVKSHINSIYGKLGAQRRTQAITIARDLGLLSD